MLSMLFIIFFLMIFGRMLGFAIKATWSIMKVLVFLVFLPLILIGLLVGGLVYIAFPILILVGIVSLIAKVVVAS